MLHNCIQNGRSFDNFLIDMKNKAKIYKFEGLEDSLIHDRIACGVDSKEMRERLLRDSKLILKKLQIW